MVFTSVLGVRSGVRQRYNSFPQSKGCCNVSAMVIGDRLRELREAKNLSQGDIEKRTGLFRCYTSRVENGHTVPSVETLEKYASALEIPLYKLFYDDTEPLQKPIKAATKANPGKGSRAKDDRELTHRKIFVTHGGPRPSASSSYGCQVCGPK